MSGLPASLRFGQAPASSRAAPAGRQQPAGARSAAGGAAASKVRSASPLPHAGPSTWLTHAVPDCSLQADAAWQAECERVAAQLVIAVPAGGPSLASTWRPQLERALASLASLQATRTAARDEVQASAAQLAADAEALAATEAAAGAALAGLREQHKAALAQVATLQQEAASRQEYVGQLQEELAFLNKVRRWAHHCRRVGLAAWLRCSAPCACWPPPTLHTLPPMSRSWRSGSARWRSRATA